MSCQVLVLVLMSCLVGLDPCSHVLVWILVLMSFLFSVLVIMPSLVLVLVLMPCLVLVLVLMSMTFFYLHDKSLEMADYMFCPHKKITSHTFIITGALIVIMFGTYFVYFSSSLCRQ